MRDGKYVVLFVCSGNSCRSPMAEGLLKSMLPDDIKEKVIVESAGTLGIVGQPATQPAIDVADEYGVDLRGHRSQGLTRERAYDADLILVMAPEHIEFLRRFFPEARDNVFLVRQFGREKDEDLDPVIEDPIGGSLDVYRATIQLIHEELERILPIIRRLVLERLSWSS